MSALSVLSSSDGLEVYQERLSRFHEVADFMGELAELLSHVADALSYNPDEVDLSLGEGLHVNGLCLMDHDWPSLARVQSLQIEWRAARDALLASWNALSERERANASSLPPFGARDLTRPLL